MLCCCGAVLTSHGLDMAASSQGPVSSAVSGYFCCFSPGNCAVGHNPAALPGSSTYPQECNSKRVQAGFSLYLAGLSELVCMLYLYHDSPSTYWDEPYWILRDFVLRQPCLQFLSTSRQFTKFALENLLTHVCPIEGRVPRTPADVQQLKKYSPISCRCAFTA